MALSVTTIATIKSLAELGLFITKSIAELSSGEKTPEQIKERWVEVSSGLADAWDTWDSVEPPK